MSLSHCSLSSHCIKLNIIIIHIDRNTDQCFEYIMYNDISKGNFYMFSL